MFSSLQTSNYNNNFSQEIISDHCFHFVHENLFYHLIRAKNRVQRCLYLLLHPFLENFSCLIYEQKTIFNIHATFSIKFIEIGVNTREIGFCRNNLIVCCRIESKVARRLHKLFLLILISMLTFNVFRLAASRLEINECLRYEMSFFKYCKSNGSEIQMQLQTCSVGKTPTSHIVDYEQSSSAYSQT